DGQTSDASFTASEDSPGLFQVQGAHAYALPGQYTATISVTDSGGFSAQTTCSMNVAEAPLTYLATPSDSFNVAEGQFLDGATLGTLNDPDPNSTADDLTGIIHWGDGTATSSATFVPVDDQPGAFSVLGSHTYGDPGNYTVTINFTDTLGGATLDDST